MTSDQVTTNIKKGDVFCETQCKVKVKGTV